MKEIIGKYGIPLLVLLISATLVFHHAFGEFAITSDSEHEYDLYLLCLESGKWQNIPDHLLTSCLMTTLLPASIQGILNLDNPEIVYKITLSLLIIPLPLVLYWVLRKRTSSLVAISLAIAFMTTFYFLYPVAYARLNIAMIASVGIIYVALERGMSWRRALILIGVLSALLVFSHYGTTYIIAALLGVMILLSATYLIIKDKPAGVLRRLIVCLVIICVFSAVWHFGMNEAPGRIGARTAGEAVEEVTITKTAIPTPAPAPQTPPPAQSQPGFFNLESRSPVVKTMMGLTWQVMKAEERAHLVAVWGSMLALIALLVRLCRKGNIDVAAFLFGGAILIAASVISPTISVKYGTVRTIYTLMPVALIAVATWWGWRGKNYRLAVPVLLFSLVQFYNWYVVR